MKLFAFLFVTILLASCADISKGEQITTIDGLVKTVDSISTVLIENNSDEIITISRQSHTIEKRIKDNFENDTVDFEFGKKLDEFKHLLNSLKPIQDMFSELSKNSKLEKKILLKLKHDIENGNGERGKYDEYVQFEKEKVKELCLLLVQYTTSKKEAVGIFQKLHSEINEFSLKLLP